MALRRGWLAQTTSQSDRVLNSSLILELLYAQGFLPSLLPAPANGSKISQTGFLPTAQLESTCYGRGILLAVRLCSPKKWVL